MFSPSPGPPPILCGILNVTPDSFSDGGRFMDLASAVAHGRRLLAEGAGIIDVGGESTRPGAEPVAPTEQCRRVLPVIRALLAGRGPDGPPWQLSIDTTSAEVAEAALAEGATIVNDVSAGLDDPRMLPLVARAGAGLVLMHRRARPALDSYSDRYASPPIYDDVVREVAAFLAQRVGAAIAAGISSEALAIDPGFGFGKSVEQNYELLARLDECKKIHPVVFVGLSRKSFLAAARGLSGRGSPSGALADRRTLDPAERLPASLAAAILAAQRGATVLRVHDVAATREALAVVRHVTSAMPPLPGLEGPG